MQTWILAMQKYACVLRYLNVYIYVCQLAIDWLQIHPHFSTYRKFVMGPLLCQSSFGFDMKFITDVPLP